MTTNVDVSLPDSASWDVDVTEAYGNVKTITRLLPGASQIFYCHSGNIISVREIQHESEEYLAEQESEVADLVDDDGPVDPEPDTEEE